MGDSISVILVLGPKMELQVVGNTVLVNQLWGGGEMEDLACPDWQWAVQVEGSIELSVCSYQSPAVP